MTTPPSSRADKPPAETKSTQNIDPVELASSDSFPASDPPSWTGAHTGRPLHPKAPADAETQPEPPTREGTSLPGSRKIR
jgi:hypothetical protein